MDLIERQKAIEAMGKAQWAKERLMELPSAEPEIVRCNDIINRQAAIDAIEKNAYRHTYLDQIIDIVSELPSAQPEVLACGEGVLNAQPEIVRCKECMHHRRDNTGCYYCVRKEYGYGWGLNDFCSDAERRTNEPDR